MKSLAIVDLPDLLPHLRAAGLPLLTEHTDPASVGPVIRRHGHANTVIVARYPVDPQTLQWLSAQVTQGSPAALLADDPAAAPPFPRTRVLHLPATIGDLADLLRAGSLPPEPRAVVIGTGGRIMPLTSADTPDGAPDAEDDDWSMTPVMSPVEALAEPVPEIPRVPDLTTLDRAPQDRPNEEQTAPPAPPGPAPDHRAIRIHEATRTGANNSIGPVPEATRVRPADDGHDSTGGHRHAHTHPGLEYPPADHDDAYLPGRGVKTGGFPPVVVVTSAKGGVGKTTLAITLAERAASLAGNTVDKIILVDVSRGQADVRKYLRVGRSDLPDVHDIASGVPPERVIVSPTALAAARAGYPAPHFGVVLAPRPLDADPEVVTTDVYRSVIDAARHVAGPGGLVVLDIQIAEAFDTSGLYADLVLPMLADPRENTWLLGVTDTSTTGASNLIERFSRFAELGAARTRMLTIVNKVPDDTVLDIAAMTSFLAAKARVVGSIPEDGDIDAATKTGHFSDARPDVAAPLDAVLHTVTGNAIFDAESHPERYARGRPAARPGLLSRFRRGGGR